MNEQIKHSFILFSLANVPKSSSKGYIGFLRALDHWDLYLEVE